MEGWFERLLKDIKELKIQGAEHVARAGVAGLARLARERGSIGLRREAKLLLATRPTEPMLQNAVTYFLSHATKRNHEEVAARIDRFFDEADTRIAAYGSKLIVNGKTYATHCHSSTVLESFFAAQKAGKSFSVRNTETRPRYQGRKTARELVARGIPVTHFVDSGARLSVKKADALFLGADALLGDGKIANKIGSEMLAELAHERDVPVYILANSWKFTPQHASAFKDSLEIRDPREIWKDAPKGVTVNNYAFELIEPRYITAVITEHGIRDPYTTAKELKMRSQYLFPTKKGI